MQTNSWFNSTKRTFKTEFPTELFSGQDSQKTIQVTKKVKIKPSLQQRQELQKWWHAYRHTYNKTIESLLPNEVYQIIDQDGSLGLEHTLEPRIKLRLYTEPTVSFKINVSKKTHKVSYKLSVVHDPSVKDVTAKLVNEYLNIERWENFRDRFVTAKNNTFFVGKEWLLDTYKTVRASACKDACASYKTVKSNCQRYYKKGSIRTMGFKSKRSDSWSVGMEAKNIRYYVKKRKKRHKRVNKRYVDICGLKSIRCCERIEPGFGDPKVHKDRYGDYYLLLPYEKPVLQNRTERPGYAIDCGIKSFVNGYDTHRNTYKHVTQNDKMLALLRTEDAMKALPDNRFNESRMSSIRKRLKNMVDDMHWKVANKIVKENNLIVLGRFRPSSILKSSTITKAAKRKLSALSHYRFKCRLLYKSELHNVKLVQWSEWGTTKTCPCCGVWNQNIRLGEDTFLCPICNYVADRDDKAACCIYIRYKADV